MEIEWFFIGFHLADIREREWSYWILSRNHWKLDDACWEISSGCWYEGRCELGKELVYWDLSNRILGQVPVVGLEVEVITSLNKESLTIQIFPNPGEGDLMIRFNGTDNEEISFELTDMNGRMMKQMRQSPNREGLYMMPMGDLELSGGLYLLQLRQGDSRNIVKVMRK